MLFNDKVLFITYLFDENGLWHTIPMAWKNAMTNIPKDASMHIPRIIEIITKYKQGTEHVKNIWSAKDNELMPIGQQKWWTELNMTMDHNWNSYSLSKVCKPDPKTRYFNFQVLHRTTVTDRKLLQFNIKYNDRCDAFQEVETIFHLLYECPTSKVTWNSLEQWFLQDLKKEKMDKQSILLGEQNNEAFVNALNYHY